MPKDGTKENAFHCVQTREYALKPSPKYDQITSQHLVWLSGLYKEINYWQQQIFCNQI